MQCLKNILDLICQTHVKAYSYAKTSIMEVICSHLQRIYISKGLIRQRKTQQNTQMWSGEKNMDNKFFNTLLSSISLMSVASDGAFVCDD